MSSSSGSSLGRSAMVVSLGTLSSRVLGLVRDIAIAAVFGASRVTDVFFIAFQIPSMFRKLLGEGALSSSVVPVLTDAYENRTEQQAKQLADAAFTWAFLAVGLLCLGGILGAPYLVMAIAPGFIGTPYFSLTVQLTRVLFPFLICMSAASVVMGVLHARGRFAPSAFAPAAFNVMMITGAFVLAPRLGASPEQRIWGLAAGVLVGGLAQFLIQWWALGRDGVNLAWNPDWNVPGLGRILSMMGPMAFGLAFSQMIVFVDKMVASFLDAGNISHLYYSNRLFQFPFALIGIAVGTVVLPEASRQVATGASSEVEVTARNSIGMMSFLMLPSTVGLWVIGLPLIRLLFGGDRFGPRDQLLTYGVLVFALLGLTAYGLIRIFVSLCYSFEDTSGPVIAGAVAFVINAVLDVGLVWAWPEPTFRVCGLTLAGSVAVWTQAWVLRRRLARHLPDSSLVPWRSLVRHAGASLLMGALIYPLVGVIPTPFWSVAVGCAGGVAIYFIIGFFANDPYQRDVLANLVQSLSGETPSEEAS